MRNREAEALARLLEDGPARSGEGSAELRRLSALAETLVSAAPGGGAPDTAFKTELRAMLVEEARLQQAQAAPRILPRVRAATATAVERWRYSTRVAAASLAAALTFSGGGAVAVAAERALPSDALYGVKLVLDDARAAVRFDSVAKGEIHLANAAERIDEAEQSAALGDESGAARALHESADSARKGARELIRGYEERGDAQIVARLSDFAEAQSRRVRVLAEQLSGEGRQAARDSLVVLERIEARLVAIGGVCGDCPAEAPLSGGAFDFSEIPPADEPFQPCPCDDGDGDGDGAVASDRDGDTDDGDTDDGDATAPPPGDPPPPDED
ncbi:MAG TPA: DUF5667 domain-containing protein, partial [Egibacteraceae bacterium]|nr:DUF5667 domain-containing protein [Egibacteraceae bacterium]